MSLSKYDKLKRIQEATRSYSAVPAIDPDLPTNLSDEDFEGAAWGAQQVLAAVAVGEYSPETMLPDYGNDEEEERSFAEHEGLVLRASRTNPAVKRWVKLRSQQYTDSRRNRLAENRGKAALGAAATAGVAHVLSKKIADPAGQLASTAVASGIGSAMIAASAAHAAGEHIMRRNKGRWGLAHTDDATHHEHYLAHHSQAVKDAADKAGVSERTVANAMAFWGRHHLKMSNELGEKTKRGQERKEHHKDLGHLAVRSFNHGMNMASRGINMTSRTV